MLAAAHGIATRLPYQSDPTLRAQINAGEVDYIDDHLSHSAQHMWFGFYGQLDVAVVEVDRDPARRASSFPAARSATTRPGSTRRTG